MTTVYCIHYSHRYIYIHNIHIVSLIPVKLKNNKDPGTNMLGATAFFPYDLIQLGIVVNVYLN